VIIIVGKALDEHAQQLLTIITHMDLYRYTRLPFRASLTPAIFRNIFFDFLNFHLWFGEKIRIIKKHTFFHFRPKNAHNDLHQPICMHPYTHPSTPLSLMQSGISPPHACAHACMDIPSTDQPTITSNKYQISTLYKHVHNIISLIRLNQGFGLT
jgi:hypothetical protein